MPPSVNPPGTPLFWMKRNRTDGLAAKSVISLSTLEAARWWVSEWVAGGTVLPAPSPSARFTTAR